jgi:hypothetical protein
MPSVGFEPAIPGSEEPQTHFLDRTAIGIHVKLVALNLKVSQCRHICSCLLTINISRAILITFLIYTPIKFHMTSSNDLLVIAMKVKDKEINTQRRACCYITLYKSVSCTEITKIVTVWSVETHYGLETQRRKRFSLLHTLSDMP